MGADYELTRRWRWGEACFTGPSESLIACPADGGNYSLDRRERQADFSQIQFTSGTVVADPTSTASAWGMTQIVFMALPTPTCNTVG